MNVLETLNHRLDVSAAPIARLDTYYAGSQPLSFLSVAAREALGNGLCALAVNFPRLAVDAVSERLRVVGFSIDGQANDAIWQAWQDAGMDDGHQVAHTEALVCGRSFVIVWADSQGRPTLSVESARNVAVLTDPVTGQVISALKRWIDGDGKARAVMFTPSSLTEYVSQSSVGIPEWTAAPSLPATWFPATGWNAVKTWGNPLGVVPIVPIVNKGRLLDVNGVSEMAPVMDLADAVNKLLSDMMVTSEFFARPRRWVSGLEVQEDDNGNPVNPFSDSPERVWQSEDPATKFGEFAGSSLAGYDSAIKTLTQMVGAMSGLPPHYLNVLSDQPASADAIRSSEASLVAKCLARQRTFGRSWAQVAALVAAIVYGRAPGRIETVWASPETRTPAQAADAAVKLHAEGIVPTEQVLLDLGYSPEQITNMRSMRVRDAIDAAPLAPAPPTQAAA